MKWETRPKVSKEKAQTANFNSIIHLENSGALKKEQQANWIHISYIWKQRFL